MTFFKPKRLMDFLNKKVRIGLQTYRHSHTIVDHISKDGHYYIFPDKKQIRSISLREAARIQSFPDYFYFEGGRTVVCLQIGDAAPPIMAKHNSASIKELLKYIIS